MTTILPLSSAQLSVSSDGSNGMQPPGRGPLPGPRGPFQYPRTDRTGCNFGVVGLLISRNWLSVSSDGSNGVQHQGLDGFDPVPAGFQYPRTDRTGCNHPKWPRVTLSSPSFSILGRIERGATLLPGMAAVKRSHLSVSSDGSNGMQRSFSYTSRPFRSPFSILGRIERDATTCSTGRLHTGHCLSVSSDGSNGMQQTPFAVVKIWAGELSVSSDGSNGMQPTLENKASDDDSPFSILGRIERDATNRRVVPPRPSFRLSVSSDGSNGMQPFFVMKDFHPFLPFSILGRIERDATRVPHRGVSLPPRAFSILGRIERDATSTVGIRRDGCWCLSVSSDGSNGMQRGADDWACCTDASFSILGRIERDATRIDDPVPDLTFTCFQYPRTDRTGCNPILPPWPASDLALSVSSDGSNGMQLHRPTVPQASSDLSVSSDGSNGMQRIEDRDANPQRGPFSILGRIERDATQTSED